MPKEVEVQEKAVKTFKFRISILRAAATHISTRAWTKVATPATSNPSAITSGLAIEDPDSLVKEKDSIGVQSQEKGRTRRQK